MKMRGKDENALRIKNVIIQDGMQNEHEMKTEKNDSKSS